MNETIPPKKLLRFRIIKGIGKDLFEIAGSRDGKP